MQYGAEFRVADVERVVDAVVPLTMWGSRMLLRLWVVLAELAIIASLQLYTVALAGLIMGWFFLPGVWFLFVWCALCVGLGWCVYRIANSGGVQDKPASTSGHMLSAHRVSRWLFGSGVHLGPGTVPLRALTFGRLRGSWRRNGQYWCKVLVLLVCLLVLITPVQYVVGEFISSVAVWLRTASPPRILRITSRLWTPDASIQPLSTAKPSVEPGDSSVFRDLEFQDGQPIQLQIEDARRTGRYVKVDVLEGDWYLRHVGRAGANPYRRSISVPIEDGIVAFECSPHSDEKNVQISLKVMTHFPGQPLQQATLFGHLVHAPSPP